MTRKPQAIRDSEAKPAEARPIERDGARPPAQARAIKIERGFLPSAEGSAMISMGRTRVICTASVEDRVPNWMRGRIAAG